jgi:hypothetical protein
MLLHFFQPPPQPISLALTQHMTKGLHLACRASQRLVGLDQLFLSRGKGANC